MVVLHGKVRIPLSALRVCRTRSFTAKKVLVLLQKGSNRHQESPLESQVFLTWQYRPRLKLYTEHSSATFDTPTDLDDDFGGQLQ